MTLRSSPRMSSRRQYNMPPTEDTREALLEDTAPSTRLLPWAALACLGAANAAEAVEVLCASYLLKGLKGAPARAAVSSGVYAGMLVGGVGGGLLGDAKGRARSICLAMLLAFVGGVGAALSGSCLLYTSPSPRDATLSRMPSSA